MKMRRLTGLTAALTCSVAAGSAHADVTGAVVITYPVVAEDFGGAMVSVIVPAL